MVRARLYKLHKLPPVYIVSLLFFYLIQEKTNYHPQRRIKMITIEDLDRQFNPTLHTPLPDFKTRSSELNQSDSERSSRGSSPEYESADDGTDRILTITPAKQRSASPDPYVNSGVSAPQNPNNCMYQSIHR
jgi:hypothetical protein